GGSKRPFLIARCWRRPPFLRSTTSSPPRGGLRSAKSYSTRSEVAHEIVMPRVDMDMKSGRMGAWRAAEGARVVKGETLFEIETDKAAMEIDAPASGVLRFV